jgi:hypothetical protein
MGLQSKLFHGDPKLEAAAMSDPAHIMRGARGEHVRKIQLALIMLDGADIKPDGDYGPATANSLLTNAREAETHAEKPGAPAVELELSGGFFNRLLRPSWRTRRSAASSTGRTRRRRTTSSAR